MSTPALDIEIPTLASSTALSDGDKAFLREVAAKIRAVEPEAEILLYGSRARGDAREDSDWDLFLVLPERPDLARRQALYAATGDYMYDERTYLSMLVEHRERYRERAPWHAFLHNVHEDAVRL